MKIYYPCTYGDTPEERNSGVVPAAEDSAPYPVVILLPGINLGPEGCAWLARQLALAGAITVACTAIAEEMPGYISISPGLLFEQLSPGGFGRAPSCSLLQPVMDELAAVQQASVLAGLLDLDRIILGGHSAGGTAALLNANPEWFPGVCGVFSYAAHTGASVALGWPAETVLRLPATLPTLLLAGDRDGVIAASAHRYGREGADPLHTVCRTFDEGVHDCGGRSYLMVLAGATHFTCADPHDGTTGREFLDWDSDADQAELRGLMGQLIADFVAATARADERAVSRLQDAQCDSRLALVKSR
ncbi:dienelactone hydrolase [Halioglobus maricola]|uniref:Dienelactone hydrolase n=2 Tax=Halioglobus maricola TaxID=2601894 RepID=A0A5P9NEZ4_9GAMM|nr:dienelactone hydrolase [Halioglobus maricola]